MSTNAERPFEDDETTDDGSGNSAADAGSESPEEGEDAMEAAEDAVVDDGDA